ncbi:U3 small nucleolar RNA-associated protein [Acarospora aff. strigata]|nr:U3 small nucleolar RNA-associated protein [Acarospora aff. strigata]
MDIHRCRFVPYPPSAINALAFSHPSNANAKGKGPATLRLAIGRANGDIEIWNPLKGSWFQETILRGGKDRSIEGLVWTQDPDEEDRDGWRIPGKLRLFSIGYSATVTEWDLELGKPIRHSSGSYGEAWCIAAQPRVQARGSTSTDVKSEGQFEGQHLAVGCADGAVVLFSTADGDLRFIRTLTRPSTKRARSLSIAFKNRDVVVAGYADSTIRAFDVRNGQLLRSMSLGSGPTGGPREILVWSVKCLPDGTIVSGDSTGELRFWDGNNYTLVQRLKSHVADILDVAVSSDGESVMSGGMDRRTTVYKRVGSGKNGDRRRWAELSHQRFHSHDVKVLATFETKNLSIVASGGLDTTPIIIPFREFGKEYYRKISSLPQSPQLHSAPAERLIMTWWEREISIWRVYGSPEAREDSEGLDQGLSDRTRKLVARIAVKGEENITSACISANGKLLAVSTVSEVKLFRLRQRTAENTDALRVSKFEVPQALFKNGAKLLVFSPDTHWLAIVDVSNSIRLFRILEDSASKIGIRLLPKAIDLKRVHRERAKQTLQHGSLGNYDRTVIRATFSEDSRVLVGGDLSGYLDSWVLEGHEDLTQTTDDYVGDARTSSPSSDDESDGEKEQPVVILGEHWIRNPAATLLPKLPSAPLVLSFRPSRQYSGRPVTNGNTAVHPTRHNPHPHSHDLPAGEDRLLVLTCEHHIYEFHILKGRLSEWSRRNPTQTLPGDFREVRDRAMGCVWDISEERQRVWLYGSGWLWMFDLGRDFASPKKDTIDAGPRPEDNSTSNTANRKKRKLEDRHSDADADEDVNRTLSKHDSGAGGKVRASQLSTGIGRKIRRTIGPDTEDSRWTWLDEPGSPDSDDGDDDEELPGRLTALAASRRGPDGGPKANAAVDGEGGDVTNSRANGSVERKGDEGPGWWSTYKYRPILGIVPIGTVVEEGVHGNGRPGIEVALVERPMWDVDLPPRYYGDQEWDQ